MTISLKSKASGNPNLDLVFDPYVQGTYVADTGILADASLGGQDIAKRYAPLVYGTAALATGLLTKQTGNADLNTLFAAYGTASYSLPINGNSYSNNGGRGTSSISFFINSNGTYSVIFNFGQVSQSTVASGTWLPSGDSVSQYTVMYAQTGATSGPDPGGGTDSYSNDAPTQKACTNSQQFYIAATATTVLTNANNACSLYIYLYKLGSIRYTTSISLDCAAAG